MMQEEVLELLKKVKYPGFSRDIVSFGLVKEIRIDEGKIGVNCVVTTGDAAVVEEIRKGVDAVLHTAYPQCEITVSVEMRESPASAQGGGGGVLGPNRIAGVKRILAVASGKGGVGKSTVASNLAVALSAHARVGLCDCDIYGPSVPLLFGASENPLADENDRILPLERFGLKLMSMGFFVPGDAPIVLRGPMVTRYTQQFLQQVAWGELDYLILDLPPGTGDIALTIVQTVALDGAVVVTTPQEMALIDARKAVAMFQKTGVQVLGLVENMSYFLCPSDGIKYDIFGTGGAKKEAERIGVSLLGSLPIEPALRESCDRGVPMVLAHPNSISTKEFASIAEQVTALTSSN